MRAAILFLLFFLLLDARSLKVASWNVENLFDLQRQGTEYEEYIPGRHGWSGRTLDKKLNHLAEVICDLDADILALQEVENDEVLAALQRRLKRVGCPYPHRYITRDRETPVHVALLSRLKLKQHRDLKIAPSGRYRSILEAAIPGRPPLRLFVNHWRSKAGPESERIRYARALKGRLERLPPGSEYLLLGDFNSDYQEFRVIDARHNDRNGRTGINHILGTIRNGRMVRRRDLSASGGEGRLHYTLWMELPATERWSHNFYGDKEAIDAILIPPTLLDGKGWEYRPGSFGVYRPKYLIGRHGEVRRWEYRHGKHSGRGYSDHLPVYAVFEKAPNEGTDHWWRRLTGGNDAAAEKEKERKKPGKSEKRDRPEELSIEALNRLDTLDRPVRLRRAAVVFKRGRNAVLQQEPKGEAILVYGAAAPLEEGRIYDLELYGLKRYKGMPELTDLEISSPGKKVDTAPYLLSFSPELFEGRGGISHVVRDLEGIYRKGNLTVEGASVPIHFKKRRWRPPEGSRLMIKRAQIGYYKNHKELVIWDRRDFDILR